MDILRTLEDTVLAALKTALSAKVKTIELYSDQLTAGTMEDITYRFPCVYAVAGGVAFEPINRVTQATVQMMIYVGDDNARGDSAAKRGFGANPGVFWILEQVRAYINGLRIHDAATPLQIKSIEPIIYAPESDILIYAAAFECKWIFK